MAGGALAGLGFGGLIGGITAAAPKKAGYDTGNVFTKGMTDQDYEKANQSLQDFLNYHGNGGAALDPIEASRTATGEVQNNAILGQLYGKGGVLSSAIGDEKNLAGRGYSLQPEDYEAYGQAQGNIARQFDASQGNLAQALSNRGLSSSGVASQNFATSEGNKLEMLGQLQTKIAQDRMQSNLARLSQAQSFLNAMGQNAQGAIGQQYGRQMQSEQQNFNEAQGKAQAGQHWLGNVQGQANEQLEQRQGTSSQPGWAKGLQGALSGMAAAGGAMGGAGQLSGAMGGGSGGGGSSAFSPSSMPSSENLGQNNPNRYNLGVGR